MPRIKYPRTPHLPWSPGATNDDTHVAHLRDFETHEVVVTEKLDGENTTLYRDGLHARSLDPRPHPSRAWVKALQGQIGYRIPPGWRLCGENLYARHSLPYDNLEGYFYLFSVWDDHNVALSWDDTVQWATELNLPHPRVLYRGSWDEAHLRALRVDDRTTEGYVVRVAEAFAYQEFPQRVAKWVRAGHVTTDAHWMHGPLLPNGLRRGA